MSSDSSYPTVKIEEALQTLRDFDKYGFGYESGVPMPFQHYYKSLNKAHLVILESLAEIVKNLSSPTTKTKEEQ